MRSSSRLSSISFSRTALLLWLSLLAVVAFQVPLLVVGAGVTASDKVVAESSVPDSHRRKDRFLKQQRANTANADVTTTSSSSSSHSSQSQSQSQSQNHHRQLNQFTLPFSITWRIAIGNGGTDRQPTADDYEAVRQATENWFTAAIDELYGSKEGLTLDRVDCTLAASSDGGGGGGASWNPESPDGLPHAIPFDCDAVWDADTVELVPKPVDFLVNLNTNTQVSDFIVNYLFASTGPDSVFRFSQNVSYETGTKGDITTPSSGPSTAPGGGGDGGSAGGEGPATTPSDGGTSEEGGQPQPAAAQPQPTPSPTSSSSFSSGWIIPFRLTFNLSIREMTTTDRQPTPEEYEGLRASIHQWLFDSLQQAYAGQTDTFVMSDVIATIISTSWDPNISTDPIIGTSLPHQINMDAFAVYSANDVEDVPTVFDFFITLRSDAVPFSAWSTNYLPFVEPVDSLFRSTATAQYTSTQNGPRFSAEFTANPNAPPTAAIPNNAPTTAATTTTVPTPAPVRTTPSPVNPDRFILATVPTESNWTYTISEEFGVVDRQPTQEEYEGLVDSTHEWLSRIYNDYYNTKNNIQNWPRFVGVETSLVKGIYQVSGPEDANSDFPSVKHIVMMKFDFTFAVDETDPDQKLPFLDEIYDVIQQADLNYYILLYVHTSEPIETSVFHGVNSVSWAYSMLYYTYIPRPTRPPTTTTTTFTTTESTTTNGPTNTPMSAAANPPPTADLPTATPITNSGQEYGDSLTNNDAAAAADATVSLLYRYRLNNDAARAATQAEWDGLGEATRSFWIAKLDEHFQGEENAAAFGVIDGRWQVGSTTYSASDEFPHSGRYLTEIIFKEGTAPMHTMEVKELMSGLLKGSNYIGTYVRNALPVDSLFRDTLDIQWDY